MAFDHLPICYPKVLFGVPAPYLYPNFTLKEFNCDKDNTEISCLQCVKIRYIKGYPSLAAFIASESDRSTSIYRRLDRLSARNLFYLQSELVELEARLDILDAADPKRTTDEKKSARAIGRFLRKGQDALRKKERMEVVKEIREKLKEYSL